MKLSSLLFASSLLVGCTGESNLGNTTESNVPPPNTRWAVSFGSDGTDFINKVALDGAGDVIAIGESEGQQNLDGQLLLGSRNAFVTKRAAADGAELWRGTLQFTAGDPSGFVKIADVAVDSHDDILVLATVSSAPTYPGVSQVDLGGFVVDIHSPPDASSTLAYAVKYSPTGQVIWAKQIGREVYPYHLALDATDRIYVAGNFPPGTVTIAGTTYTNAGPQSDMPFVAAYDAELGGRWSTELPFNSQDPMYSPSGIAIMGNGDLAVTHQIDGERPMVTMGGVTGWSWFISQFDDDGALVRRAEFAAPTPSPNSPFSGVMLWNPIRVAPDRLAFSIWHYADSYNLITEVRTVDNALTDMTTSDMGPTADFGSGTDGAGLVGVELKSNAPDLATLLFFSIDDTGQKTSTAPFATCGDGIEGITPLGWWFGQATGNASTVVFGGQLGPDMDFGLGPMRAHDTNGDAFIVALDNPTR
ncbi:MAG TPA: hypothetical protein VGM90_15240 [Kofleriaceae bacterium]|jgi:hypothetical protein